MSDSPRFRALSPNPYITGLLLDPKPALERGFAAAQLRTAVPDAVVSIPNAMSGTAIVRNPRSRLEAGVNAPRAGRAPGGDRPALSVYGPSTLEWALKIFSQKLPRSPNFSPELQDWWNNPDVSPAVAAAGQRATEQEWLELLRDGCDVQDERAFAEALFGTDLAGTGSTFTYASVSADATHNPDGLTFDDDTFPFVDFMARVVHTLDLAMGASGQSRYVITMGEALAHKLERNKQLLGIQVKVGDQTGVAMINGEIRLTRTALATRIESLTGIRKFIRAGAIVSLTDGTDANASNSWMWPEGLNVCAMGNVNANVNPVNNRNVRINNTGLLVLTRPSAQGRIYLPQDEIQFEGHADIYRQYLPVDSAAGLSFANA